MSAPRPANEAERLHALRRYQILDTPSEVAFDRLTALAARLLDVPIAQVTLVDEHRQWFKASHGAPRGETPRKLSFCAHAILQDDVLSVSDATNDPRFSNNALVTGDPKIRAYAGAQIKSADGFNLGTVCAIDTVPREFTPEQREILHELAAIAADEMELRLAIEERTHIAHELHESLEKLRKTEAQRDDLTNMIIHDLRSPLTTVKGYVDALAMTAGDKLNADEAKCVTEAQRGANDLREMISTLLDVSRFESGEMPLKIDNHDAAKILQDAARRFEPVLKDRTFHCEAPNDLTLNCDADVIRRVLENLIGNAVKFTKSDGTIRVSVEPNCANVKISVADNGHGVPQDQYQRIFEKFGQVNGATHHRHSTGLGLAFCRLAVEAHGGTITVESEPGHGSTFSFLLPR
jgi:signal transduction histidine kinase